MAFGLEIFVPKGCSRSLFQALLNSATHMRRSQPCAGAISHHAYRARRDTRWSSLAGFAAGVLHSFIAAISAPLAVRLGIWTSAFPVDRHIGESLFDAGPVQRTSHCLDLQRIRRSSDDHFNDHLFDRIESEGRVRPA